MTPSLASRLSVGWHAFRQLGPRRGTIAALRRIAHLGRGRYRALTVARRPLQASDAELALALAGRTPAAALEAARLALPSLVRWQQELPREDAVRREDLLERADRVLAHRFDLLGSGPCELGAEIDWHRDFKTGRVWPRVHISKVPVSYPDASDIKVPWELSRAQHLPLLAAAHLLTGERRYLDELGAQLTSWIDANPVEIGVNWACTMDVAIRATNWIAALALIPEAAGGAPWIADVLKNLLLHGRFIRGHPEWAEARGNHYLSDVAGLLVCAAPFAASAEGGGWARWATRELGREMAHQVRRDGCDHEASISYHRLVAELFIVGADAAEALCPGELDPSVRAGITRMLEFVADYTRPDGLAPQIGDADDGRLLPLGDYGAVDQRDHLHLFRQADAQYRRASRPAAYPHGGFYVLRSGPLYAAVHCGDVGIYGRGCHAHNDALAFELCCGETPLVVDPGSYLYTADPAARNHFRSTRVHSALQIDGAEQNELREDRLFAMVDRARAEVEAWDAAPESPSLRGRHRGFMALADPVGYRRSLTLDGGKHTLEVLDELESRGAHQLSLALTFPPCEIELSQQGAQVELDGLRVEIAGDALCPELEEGWISPGYGRRSPARVIRFRGTSSPGTFRNRLVIRVAGK